MNAVDTKLKRLLEQVSLGPGINPLNLNEEREAFLHSRSPRRSKSPVFRYNNSPLQWADFKPVLHLDSMDAPEEVVEIYKEKQRELNMTKNMLAAVGSNGFTQFAIDIFGEPTDEDARRARKVLGKLSDIIPPERNCSAKEFAGLLKKRLQELDIFMDIRLVPSMATKVSVDSVSRTIHINRNSFFAHQEINRLIVHEIDVHVIRIHNGSGLPWGIFSMGTPGYRETEEGLAVYHERQSGHLYPFQEKIYAGRCLAVYLSLSYGFSEVFEELKVYFDEKTAYTIVERVKRGLTDTSRPGALTKEFHYFTGPDKVQSYIHDGGNLLMLMAGKIAFKYAPIIEKLIKEGLVNTSKWVFPSEFNGDRKSKPA